MTARDDLLKPEQHVFDMTGEAARAMVDVSMKYVVRFDAAKADASDPDETKAILTMIEIWHKTMVYLRGSVYRAFPHLRDVVEIHKLLDDVTGADQ